MSSQPALLGELHPATRRLDRNRPRSVQRVGWKRATAGFVIGQRYGFALVRHGERDDSLRVGSTFKFDLDSLELLAADPLLGFAPPHLMYVTESDDEAIYAPDTSRLLRFRAGVVAGMSPGPALVAANILELGNTEWPMPHRSDYAANAPVPYLHIYVQFNAGWDAPLTDEQTASERAALQETTRTTIEQAFEGYAVTASVGTIEDAKLSKYTRRIQILRIPAHPERRFRLKVNVDSDRC